MLDAIKRFFDEKVGTAADGTGEAEEHALRLATAALLVEMTRMDDQVRQVEQDAVMAAIRERFDLAEAETRRIVELAEAEAQQATDYFQFTSLINRSFSPRQKAKVVEYLWQVAYADGHLDSHEEHMIRRLADLLHVSHGAYINAKLRAGG